MNEILSPYLRRVQTQLLGHQVNGAFHTESRFGPTSTPVGAGRRLVGNHAQDFDAGRGCLVRSNDSVAGPVGRPGGGVGKVGPGIPHYAETDAQNGPIVLNGCFHVDGMASAVEPQHVFLAVGHPFDGPAQGDRQVGYCQVLGEYAAFFAEATSHVGSYDPHLAFLQAQ